VRRSQLLMVVLINQLTRNHFRLATDYRQRMVRAHASIGMNPTCSRVFMASPEQLRLASEKGVRMH
jgi:hypothetical protein